MAFQNDAGFEDDFRKVGADVTAGFEPATSPSNPTEHASSENLNVAPKDDDLEDDDEVDEDDDLEDDDDLLDDEDVPVVFGCWTSTSRRAVRPLFEERKRPLFYSVQYEGIEASPDDVGAHQRWRP